MRKMKLFSFLALALVTMSFVSCGDDEKEETVTGSFSDLIGTYTGKEAVYLVDIRRDTIKNDNKAVDFQKSSQSVNNLIVNFRNNIGADIIATNSGISNTAYPFGLSPINLPGDTDIPQYMRNWLAIDVDYTFISKIDLNLTALNGGSFNRTTNTMSMKYTGKLKFYYTRTAGGDATKEYDIVYEYKDLKK